VAYRRRLSRGSGAISVNSRESDVRALQVCLLLDPAAPAAAVPHRVTPFHHPHWWKWQLAPMGSVDAQETPDKTPVNSVVRTPPTNRGGLLVERAVQAYPNQTYRPSRGNGEIIPIITLEQSVQTGLREVLQLYPVLIEGTCNFAGPWIVFTKMITAERRRPLQLLDVADSS